MDDKYFVHVVYKNGRQEVVQDVNYELRDYTDMLRADLLRVITNIEDLVYEANNQRPKEEWPDNVWSGFCRIKHKLLDKAGEIGRLPDN